MSEKIVRLVLRLDESGKFVGEIKKGDRALHDMGTTAKKTGGQAKGLSTDTNNLGKSLLSAERSAVLFKTTLATLGIGSVAALLVGSARQARSFSAALAEVSTLMADTSGLEAFSDELKAIAVEFGKLPEAEAKALYQIISAGAEGAAEQIDILRASNRLAVGGITEVEVAADGLTSIMNAYGDAVGSSAEISDQLFATMKGGKTTITEIAASIGAVVPLASQLDVSLSEVLATVVAVTAGGDSTSKAMRGLTAVLAAIVKPSSEAAELAQELGIEFNSTGLAARGFAGFLEHLVDKTGGSVDQLGILFAGTEALLPIMTLTGKGAENFAKALDEIANSAGSTEEAVRRMMEGVAQGDFNFNQLATSINVIAISLGDGLVNELAPAAASIAENLETIIDVGGTLIDVLVGLTVARGTTLAFNALTAATTAQAIGFRMMSTFGAIATTQMVAQTLAANAAAVATRGLAAASLFFGGPLGLAVGAATAAFLLYNNEVEETIKRQRDVAAETAKVTEAFLAQASAAEKAALMSLEAGRKIAEAVVASLLTQISEATTADEINRLTAELEAAQAAALGSSLALIQLRSGVEDLGEAAGETADALGLSGDELGAYEKLLATLDPIGAAVGEYREAMALLDKALATGNIPNQAEYNKLLSALDDELAGVLDQEPAAEIRAWAAAQDDLTSAQIANNAASKVWVDQHADAVEKLAEFREGLTLEIELSGLSQEQREEELIIRELLNLAKEAGIELTQDQARAEAETITVANRAAKEREQALGKNLNLYKSFIDEVEGGFKDAFKEAFRDGEGGFARLMDGFENLFLDMLAELAFQAFAKPIIVPILQQVGTGIFGLSSGQVGNVLGNQGLGQGVGQGLGSINGIGGVVGGTGGGSIGGGFDISSIGNLLSGSGLLFNSGAGNFGVDIAQLVGGGAGTQATFGNAFGRLGSAGGIAGGLAGNFLANSLLGDRGIGASIGGTLGGIAGSFIPVPILGTALGAFVGNAIGGLFGNQRPSVGEVIAARFGTSGEVIGTGTDNGGSTSAAAGFGDEISNIIARILDVTGATIVSQFSVETSQRNGLMVNTSGQGSQVFGDDLVAALQFAFAGNTTGGDADFERLFDNSNASSIEELVALLESAEQFKATLDGLTAANDNLTAGEAAIKALTDQLDGLREQAVAFGFSVAQIDIAEALSRDRLASDFNEGVGAALLQALDPVRAATVALYEGQETRIRDVIALGGDLAAVEKLNLLERRDFLRRLTEEQRAGLSDLIDLTGDFGAQLAGIEQTLAASISEQFNAASGFARAYQAQATSLLRAAGALEKKRIDLRFGSTSILSPAQQLAEARSIMEGLATRAFDGSGDTEALALLPDAVQQFVEASAAFNADNATFVSDFNAAQTLLAEAAGLATEGADAAQSQVDLLVEQSDLLGQILTALSSPSPDADLLQSQLDRLTTLNGLLDSDLNVQVDGFDAFLDGQASAETLLAELVALASTDLNSEIGSQAESLAAERIAAIETASAKAVADAKAAAQVEIDAAIARASAAELAANEAKAAATSQVENSLVSALSGEKVRVPGGRRPRFINFDDGINSTEASFVQGSSVARQLAFLNPDRLLALAKDDIARAELKRTLATMGVPGFAGGGLIEGSGTTTSDSINIRASRGEFMVRAAAVDHYGVDFFAALNAKTLNTKTLGPTNDRGGADISQLRAGLAEVRDAVLEIGNVIVGAVDAGTLASEETGRAVLRSQKILERRAS